MPIKQGDIFQRLNQIKKIVAKLPVGIGQVAKNFFVDGFEKQGWQGDSGLVPWTARKDSRNDRPLLIGKGNLRRSLNKQVSALHVAVKVTGQASKYADVHNFGFKGQVNATSKTGKPYTRQMNIPQRQFIGQTRQLDDKIRKFIEGQFKAIK